MTEYGAAAQPAVTDDEKVMASLAHILQIVGWWIAPLIIFLVKRQSRYVSFHALQALILQICILVFGIGLMVTWFAVIFGAVFRHDMPAHQPPPPAFFVVMPLMWLGFMGIWVLVLVTAILYGIKAGRGEWAAYPVIGDWARRLLTF